MKYKGQELEPITKPQVFDPPKEMLVWDDSFTEPYVKNVCAITGSHHYQVVTTLSCYSYCAEIPEAIKPKRATYLQLAEWLSKGNGLWKFRNDNIVNLNIKFDEEEFEEEVEAFVIIRPFGTTEWVEPTLENMRMGE